MRYTFQNDFPKIEKVAKASAKAFCAKCRRGDYYDDALNDSYILATEIDFDETQSDKEIFSYLKLRIVGKLLRKLHNETGARRKTAHERVELVDIQDKRKTPVDVAQNEIVQRVIKRFPFYKQAIICDFLTLGKQKPVAKKHHLTKGRISQIIKEFKQAVRFADEYGFKVVLVPAHDLPLFVGLDDYDE